MKANRNPFGYLEAGRGVVAVMLIILNAPSAALYAQQGTSQPIAYSHKVHIESAGVNCIECHVNAEKMPRASIPNIEVCQNCHNDQPLSDSPEESKVLRYVKEETAIPWIQIYSVPDHVYFSHRRHVVDGAIGCSACHGNVPQMTEPFSAQVVPVTMSSCIECHKRLNASIDCLACHR